MRSSRSDVSGVKFVLLVVVIVGTCSWLGCTKDSDSSVEVAPCLLAETWKTTHTPLREELVRLQASGQLPVAFIVAENPPRSTFLSELNSLLENTPRAELLRWSEARIEAGALTMTAREREWFNALRERTQTERERLHKVLGENFPLGYAPHTGAVNDFAFLEDFRVSLSLLHVELYESEVAQLPKSGCDTLQTMLRLSSKLAEQGTATTCLHAARLRQTTFQILGQWLARDPRHRAQLPLLAESLSELLSKWQHETEIWQGERQLGLEFYERVRRGQLVSLLPSEWHAQLQKTNKLLVTLQQATHNVDQDELFFLQAISRLEGLAKQPHYSRREDYAAMKAVMEQAMAAPESPLLAVNLLLEDFELTSLAMAQDRALCEAWHLAMRAAIENAPPEKIPENPVSGDLFDLQSEGKHWLVRGVTTPVGEAAVFIAQRDALRD
jgi:hypothetical protein